uniref:NS1 protein n=1 Tax=Coleura bat parvovirus TaxID=3141917 RepID=A0AAU7E0L7_9VIRU
MNNGDDIGSIMDEIVGDDAGRLGQPPGNLDEVNSGESAGGGDPNIGATLVKEVEQELQSVVDRFVSSLEEKDWKDSGYYVSDVYACGDLRRAERVAERLAERARTFRRGFIIITVHVSENGTAHVHSVHSCPYTNRSCRCFFKAFPEAQEDLRRLLRKPRSIETFKRGDWENITKYFLTKGRRPTLVKVRGAVQGLPAQIADLSNLRISIRNEKRSQPSVEDCHDPLADDDERKRPLEQEGAGASRNRKRRGVSSPGGRGGLDGVVGQVYELIKRIAICPLSEVVYTKNYLEHSLAIRRLDDRAVKDALDCHASIVNTWSKRDFVNYYNDETTVKIWSARSVDMFDLYYLSDEESIDIIAKLIDYQCGSSKHRFANDLVNIIDMKIPKTNCLLVISPPSAGKNFFFDAVRDYFLNVGQMQNPNRYNTFAYQDCHNRRLITWNEPNYEQKETENLKMLFAGDNLSANVKCKPQANVKRTPIICMSNTEPRFANHEAFKDRVIIYHWKAAPFLKEIKKKPRPDSVMNYIYSINN